jgi:hypothetical protein
MESRRTACIKYISNESLKNGTSTREAKEHAGNGEVNEENDDGKVC